MTHPLIKNDFEQAIRAGNIDLSATIERDLSTKTSPLASRPTANSPHHWTPTEYLGFLNQNGYPSNTINSRMATHQMLCVNALASGKYVPHEVLDAMPDIVNEAILIVKSEIDMESSNYIMEIQRASFERSFSMCCLNEYKANIRNLLERYLARPYAQIDSQMQYGGFNVKLRISKERDASFGYFGQHNDAVKKTLVIGNALSLFSYHEIDFSLVEEALAGLLQDDILCYDQVWFLTGVGWQPKNLHSSGISMAA